MDSPITEEMIVCNILREIVKNFQDDLIDKVLRFYRSYDPRKSLDKKFLVKTFKTVCWMLDETLEEITE